MIRTVNITWISNGSEQGSIEVDYEVDDRGEKAKVEKSRRYEIASILCVMAGTVAVVLREQEEAGADGGKLLEVFNINVRKILEVERGLRSKKN